MRTPSQVGRWILGNVQYPRSVDSSSRSQLTCYESDNRTVPRVLFARAGVSEATRGTLRELGDEAGERVLRRVRAVLGGAVGRVGDRPGEGAPGVVGDVG